MASSSQNMNANSQANASRPTRTGSPDFSNADELVSLVFTCGGQKRVVRIHKQHAYYRSPALRRAFEGPYKEGQTEEYVFSEEVDERAVQFLQQWIYSKRLVLKQVQSGWDHRMDGDTQDEICRDEDNGLVKLWVLAGYLCIPHLQNYIVATIIKIAENNEGPPHYSVCNWVFEGENTAVDSALLKLIVRLAVAYMRNTDFLSLEKEVALPPQMMSEMLDFISRNGDSLASAAFKSIHEGCFVRDG